MFQLQFLLIVSELSDGQARAGGAGVGGGCLGARQRIGHEALEHADVFEEPLAARLGQLHQRLRAIISRALPGLDEPAVLQLRQLPAEVSVGQRAQRFQFGEEQAFGMGGERREDAEPGAIVDLALEALLGESGAC
jgi:hypothetical protein